MQTGAMQTGAAKTAGRAAHAATPRVAPVHAALPGAAFVFSGLLAAVVLLITGRVAAPVAVVVARDITGRQAAH